jgi:regulator of cell morphogenesis and NO signaling
MGGLIGGNYRVLLVMSRFGIGLGVGDKSIGEICRDNGVDAATFLAIVNMLCEEEATDYAPSGVSLESLLLYLHHSHNYFLDFRLPAIRSELVEVLEDPLGPLSRAVLGYFDEYVAEVRKHMQYEE